MTPVSRMRLIATSSFHGARANGTTSVNRSSPAAVPVGFRKAPRAHVRDQRSANRSRMWAQDLGRATGLSVCRKRTALSYGHLSVSDLTGYGHFDLLLLRSQGPITAGQNRICLPSTRVFQRFAGSLPNCRAFSKSVTTFSGGMS